MAGKISVILLTYNRADLLPAALSSVLEQTWQDIEIVVSDDCSTDRTAEAVSRLGDPRIKYACTPVNTGSAFLNAENGFRSVTGDYVVFLADDDKYTDNEFFEKAMDIFRAEPETDTVFAGFAVDNGQEITEIKSGPRPFYSPEEFSSSFNELIPYINMATFVFRREVLEKADIFNNIFPKSSTVDYTILMKAALNSRKLAYLDRCVHLWRAGVEGSVSGSGREDMTLQAKHMFAFPFNMENYLPEDHPYYDQMKAMLNRYAFYAMDTVEMLYRNTFAEKHLEHMAEIYPDFADRKWYIYGYGEVGRRIGEFLRDRFMADITYLDDARQGRDIVRPESLAGSSGNAVLIATYKSRLALKMFKKITDMNLKDTAAILLPENGQ